MSTQTNTNGNWLTVVYKDIQPGDEAEALIGHAKMSAASWSHALQDRDAAIAAQPAHDNNESLESRTAQPAQEPTIEDGSQDWAGMDGATAWHLINRHADGWADVAKMMGEWLAANTPPAQPATEESSATQPAQPAPVAWVLTAELDKRETTTRAHLWFSDPVNCMWTPIYTAPPTQPAVPDAITDNSENPDYRAGWNECRETMLQIMKARTL